MSTTTAARRLSPKVRRLAREHGLPPRSVPGTGARGRVTAGDLLRAAGTPRPAPAGRVLASPAARRLLREADVELAEAARAADGRPLTRRRAQRALEQLGAAPADGPPPRRGEASPGGEVVTEVDVAELLVVVGRARSRFVARHGVELPLSVPVGVALASALSTGRPWSDRDGDGRRASDVTVGFHGPDGLRTVANAQDLTVAGLARRARAADPGDGWQPSSAPTVTVTSMPSVPDDVLDVTEVGVVHVGEPTPRRVSGTDHLGHEVVRTRPHVTLRLRHGEGLSADRAEELLGAVRAALVAWSLPVDG